MKLQLIYLRIHAGSSLGGYLLRTGKSCRYRISNLTSLFWPRRSVWDSPALFLYFCLNKSRVKFFCRNTCVHTMISLIGRQPSIPTLKKSRLTCNRLCSHCWCVLSTSWVRKQLLCCHIVVLRAIRYQLFFFPLLSYEGIRAFFPLSSTDFKVGVPLHIEG